ncbi:MAG: hypothetical protein ABSF16_15170 [Terracidiphilus sp.]|jgi:hypothetical protein
MNDLAASTLSGPMPAAPKTFGQILDRTYRLMRAHFKTLVGIASIPSLLMMLAIGLMEAAIWIPMIRKFPHQPAPEAMLHYFTPSVIIPVILVFSVLCLAIFSIYLAAASYASTKADSAVKVTLHEAYRLACRRGGRHLWLLVLCYLYAFLPLLIVELSAFLGVSAFVHGSIKATPAMYLLIPLAVLLYLAAIVYGILMGLRLSLAFPASIEENLPARAAIKRSFQLVRGAKGRIFLVILVIYAAIYAAMLVLELVAILLGVVGFFVMMALHAHLTAPWSYIGIGLIGICAFAGMVLFISVIYASLVAALAVLYHDQRLRNEGALATPAQTGKIS